MSWEDAAMDYYEDQNYHPHMCYVNSEMCEMKKEAKDTIKRVVRQDFVDPFLRLLSSTYDEYQESEDICNMFGLTEKHIVALTGNLKKFESILDSEYLERKISALEDAMEM